MRKKEVKITEKKKVIQKKERGGKEFRRGSRWNKGSQRKEKGKVGETPGGEKTSLHAGGGKGS